MGKIKIIVVEDENIVSKDIQQTLKKLGYDVVGIAAEGEVAIEKARALKPNIMLMDIMLKGEMNGIEAASIISKELRIPIVFLTAYADESTLNKAKISEPYGYIIKPFKEVDIHTSIEMALYKHKKVMEVENERNMLFSLANDKDNKEMLFVKSKSKQIKLNSSDVYFVEALKDYVVINTNKTRYTIHSTMKEIEKKLSTKDFVRVHRSFIVRLDKIAAIEQPNLILEDDKKTIPIGGSYKEELTKRLNFV